MYTHLRYKSSGYCEITNPFPFYIKRISKQKYAFGLKKIKNIRIWKSDSNIRCKKE